MNLILLHEHDFIADDAVRLEGRRAVHVRKVLRARTGDRIRVGILGGLQGAGRITLLTRQCVELGVELCEAPPPALPCALVLALPRPPALRRILKSATALGVKRIALIDSARVEGSFWQSSQISPEKIEEQIHLGLEQARDTIPPEISLHRSFPRFAERELPSWLGGARGWVGHPSALVPCPHAAAGSSVLIIGPEGGFVPHEIEALEAQGVEPISLGPRPLSIDTAVIALLARLAP